MHIIQVARRFLPYRGGVETHVFEVSTQLVRLGHRVTVITLEPEVKTTKTQCSGITVVRLLTAANESKFSLWQHIWQLRSLFQSADIIQAHDVFWWLLPVYPYIYDRVHTTFHGFEGVFPVRWQAKIHRLCVSALSKTSVHIGAFIQQFYFDTPTAVTYGGTRIKRSDSQLLQQEINSTPSAAWGKKLTIVFIGRLEIDTAVSEYCKVLKTLKDSEVDFKMIWVGDGSLRAVCEKWGEVTGMIGAVRPLLAQADIVFASSYLSILEGQYLGKIVCGLYTNPLKKAYLQTYAGRKHMLISGKSKTMAQKLQHLLGARQECVRLKTNAHLFAKTQTWQKVTEMYLNLWSKQQ